MDFVDDASTLLNVVRRFNKTPTRQTLAELHQQLPNLVQALEPPRPSAADAERVRTRSTGVTAVDRLPDKDLVLARQLSDRLRINELLAARLVATQARTALKPWFFVCAHAADSSVRACGPGRGRAAVGCRAAACGRRRLRRGGSGTRLQHQQLSLRLPVPLCCVQGRKHQVGALHELLWSRLSGALEPDDVDEQTLVAFYKVRAPLSAGLGKAEAEPRPLRCPRGRTWCLHRLPESLC